MHSRYINLRYSIFLLLLIFDRGWAQGPRLSYYYNPATELSWAQCHLYQLGGSRQKIPFLPVINRDFQRAPSGTRKYAKNVNVNSPIVFIGNGIVKENHWDSYIGRRFDYTIGEIDVTGKTVMFCYDFPDSIEAHLQKEFPLEKRIIEAASRKTTAVILFSHKEQFSFLYVNYEKESDIPDIPVIIVTKNSAMNILESAGMDAESVFKKWQEAGKPSESVELISRIELKIKGNFDKVETENFTFRFRKEVISEKEIKKIAQLNEKSLKFLFDCFRDEPLTWQKLFTVYFRNYDDKLFYTHHWGTGLASGEGVFIVYAGGVPNFGLIVHENTHILANSNWSGQSTSFLSEGVAMYAEARATDRDKNHHKTIQFLKEKKLFPLEEMVTFEIGMPGLQTDVAYPASGSFVGFLLESYGLKSFKDVFILEGRSDEEKKKDNSWEKAYGKSLLELEKEWLYWLANRYKIDETDIQSYLKK